MAELNEVWKMKDTEAVDEITKYQGYLETIRLDYEPLWQDVIDYLAYDRYNFKGTEQRGKKANVLIYDGSPISAWNLLVNGMQGNTVSQAQRWFSLTLPNVITFPRTSALRKYNGRLDEIPEVKVWLEAKEEVLYSGFQRSNFYGEINSDIRDASSIGTATFYGEEDVPGRKINFMSVDPGQVYIAVNRYGVVDTVFRKFKITARAAAQMFDKTLLSLPLQTQLEKNPYTEHEFIHACFPRDDQEMYFREGKWTPKIGKNNKAYVSIYIQTGNKEHVLRRDGYDRMPYAVWRWRKTSGPYGWSCAMDAIVDILKLNVMGKTMLNAAQLAVEPPLMVHKKFQGKVRMTPRGRNYYEEDDEKIFPINQGVNFSIAEEREEKVRKIIEDHFSVEFFMMLTKAAMEGRQITVPQVMEMQGEKASVLMPTVGQMVTERLQPIIDMVDSMETDAGRMPDPPGILAPFAGQGIEVDYLGPLAMAQRRLIKTQGIYQGVSALDPMVKIDPQVADIIDADETTREILKVSGWPAKAIRTADQVQAIRDGRAQAQAEAQKMAMMEMAAKNLPNVSKAVEEGSPLQTLLQAQGGAKK